ncbi:hypothetical protein ABZ388_06770 [Micromonospora parva]|uniref:hypothetical protein n=1 Tax=Micromonospora parva TaxID=1464048 RepID=UPI0033C212B5
MGEQREHQWERTDRGAVNDFAHEIANHNGPRCTVCGFFFCENCYPQGWQRTCPGPPPEGMAWDWVGDGAGHPPEDDELETYRVG